MKYSKKDRKICDAFPNGIPGEIYNNAYSHTKILPEQESVVVFKMKQGFEDMYAKIENIKKRKREAKQVNLEKEEKNYNKNLRKINEKNIDFKIFKDFNAENIDTFCSILGKEVLFEYNEKPYLVVPCFNLGVYENDINPEKITKSVDYSLFLFEDIFKVNIYLGIYKDQKHTEFFDKRICYDVIYKDITEKEHRNFYLEGFCHRGTSNSYATYKIFSESVHLIIINNEELKEYKSGIEEFDSNESIMDFLTSKQLDAGFLQSIIEKII